MEWRTWTFNLQGRNLLLYPIELTPHFIARAWTSLLSSYPIILTSLKSPVKRFLKLSFRSHFLLGFQGAVRFLALTLISYLALSPPSRGSENFFCSLFKWRKQQDLNLRCFLGHGTLAKCYLKPLGHASIVLYLIRSRSSCQEDKKLFLSILNSC